VSIAYDVVFHGDVESPIFGIRITDHKSDIIYGTNTRLKRLKSANYKKGDRVKFTFDFKVTLMGGHYSLSPAVGYNDAKTYCDWVNDMFTLNVMHNNIAEGICDLAPVIKINKEK
ncbi:MAG: Wzt carbohydrate-binding domain-containing protein, partial [Actinomycetia bacterium]|nr:Wzt carbohydrate-binding domain-containing protein [Actinomycetes bacterium]